MPAPHPAVAQRVPAATAISSGDTSALRRRNETDVVNSFDEDALFAGGNGRHRGDALPDGSRQSGGLTDRGDIPLGTWQARFVDWFRDLGFLQKPGVETKAASDVAAFVATPPPAPR
ncbi:hypothetical protein E4T56_gene6454 [Termitomyces sp. T112]|nr:hypothetical protein E4T56_gene6454 [Termitomyces sp. T112]